MGQQFRFGLIGHIQNGQPAIAPGRISDVVLHHRMVQRPATLPMRGFSGREVHAGNPPPPALHRLCRIGHVDDDEDVIDEPVQQRRRISVTTACPPNAVQAKALDFHEPDRTGIGRIGNIVDPHAGGKIHASGAVTVRIHLIGPGVIILDRQQGPKVEFFDIQQQAFGCLQMQTHRVLMDRHEIRRLRIARIAHIRNHHAPTDAGADIGITAIDHDLHAVATATLVGIADEIDIACAFGDNHRSNPCSVSGKSAIRG